MEEDFDLFDGENATLHYDESAFIYRGMQVQTNDAHVFTLLNSSPARRNDVFLDNLPAPKQVFPLRTIKCPAKPTLVSSHCSFYCNEKSFEVIKPLVEKALLKELKDNYDWSFVENSCMWKCKYFQGSNSREYEISCYWDAATADHLIEVRRVKGDSGCCNCTADIVDFLKAAVLPSQPQLQFEEKPLKKGGKLRSAPLPLPLSANTKSVIKQSNELFIQGVRPILAMSQSFNIETRLESAKMLCDLCENTTEKTLLFSQECQIMCFEILNNLLLDPHHENGDICDDIKQFAIMAFGMLCEYDCYQECFLNMKCFEEIIRLIVQSHNECGCDAVKPSCLSIQMRRQAAKGFSLLIRKAISCAKLQSQKCILLKQLECFGFSCREQWKSHCETFMEDEKLKTYALDVGLCF